MTLFDGAVIKLVEYNSTWGKNPPTEIVHVFPRAVRPTASAESSDATTPQNNSFLFLSAHIRPPASPSGTVSEDQVVFRPCRSTAMDNPQQYQPLSHALNPPIVQPQYEEEEEEEGEDEGAVEEQLEREDDDGDEHVG